MDIAATTTAADGGGIISTGTKSPKAEKVVPSWIHQAKPISFTNGVLKRHHHVASPPAVVSYKECLKNHAAAMGGHSLDGCGEFMPSPSCISADPNSLKCAACGCHRNFHRREPDDPYLHVVEYQPHHRHRPPPPPHESPNSASPPPISSSYYPSAPHMLLALSAGLNGGGAAVSPNQSSRKRFRTKFSQIQKEKMQEFAERVEWRMQKKDDELIRELCNQIGVDRNVLKVWMHNNKTTLGKRDANGIRTVPEINGDEHIHVITDNGIGGAHHPGSSSSS